jgi:hypothetical protein
VIQRVITRSRRLSSAAAPGLAGSCDQLVENFWLKTRGIDDALIQPCSGHATRQSLEICYRLAMADAQQRYDSVVGNFPV